MKEHAAKVVEVVGTSDQSVDDAIRTAVTHTSKTVRDMRWFEVTEVRGHIADGAVERFQVMLKIGFAIES